MSKTNWQKSYENLLKAHDDLNEKMIRVVGAAGAATEDQLKTIAVLEGKVRERDAIIECGREENARLTNLLIEATLKLKTVADREAAWLRSGEANLRISVIGPTFSLNDAAPHDNPKR
jgi:hypothetical protein